MGRQRRLNWVADGSPFQLIAPADALLDVLRAHGYVVYAIGNQDHLESDPPEDHTPYSATGYPSKAKYGKGYAVDIMPPAGKKSKLNGRPLPSLQKLGAQILADRKAGVSGIKWLKYMNWEPERNNGGPCYQERFMPGYARRTSSDRGHIHISGLTGFETSTVGKGYDPVARIYGEEEMAFTEQDMRAFPWQYNGRGIADNDHSAEGNLTTLGVLDFLYQAVKLIATKVDIDPSELAAIRAASKAGAEEALENHVNTVVSGVLNGLDPSNLTLEGVEQALRNVLLHGASSQPS